MKLNLSILIVDDHDTIVSGLKYELSEKFKGVSLSVAEETSTAIDLCKSNKYDIAIIDVSFKNESNSDGIDLVKTLKQDYPQIKLISYTSFADRIEYIELLKFAKVDALVSKIDGNFAIKVAIDELLNTNIPFYSKEVVNAIQQNKKRKEKQIKISGREKEVLLQLREHLTFKEIADKLCKSKSTIDSHAKSLYSKFNAHSRSELLEKTKAYSLV